MKIISAIVALISVLLCLLSFGRFPRDCKNKPPSTTEIEEPTTVEYILPESVKYNIEFLCEKLSISYNAAFDTSMRLLNVGAAEIAEMSVEKTPSEQYFLQITDKNGMSYFVFADKNGYALAIHEEDSNGKLLWIAHG